MEWEDAFRDYLKGLDSKRPVVVCRDMNVAHQEIDLKTRKPTAKTLALPMRKENAFPSCWQRGSLIPTVACIRKNRVFLVVLPLQRQKNNAGWRIDYFLVSDRIGGQIQDAKIHTQVMGSDHCPVELDLDI